MTINLKGTNVELTAAMKKYAESKVASLEKFFPSILSARVELERTTPRHSKGEVWRAEVNIRVPRRLVRAEAVAKDIYAAVDKVKDELKRELRILKEKVKEKTVRRARARAK